MDASRGDLIGVLADPLGHEPEQNESLTVTMTGQRMRLIDRLEALAADMDVDGTMPPARSAGPEEPG